LACSQAALGAGVVLASHPQLQVPLACTQSMPVLHVIVGTAIFILKIEHLTGHAIGIIQA
jgi:hypothetical protein